MKVFYVYKGKMSKNRFTLSRTCTVLAQYTDIRVYIFNYTKVHNVR